MQKPDVRNLYYITHIDNLPSILEKGILSHERIEDDQIQSARIYNTEIVNVRKEKSTPNQKSLWSYANLYFQPRHTSSHPDKRQTLPRSTSAHNARTALPNPQAPANRLAETDRSASQTESQY